MADANDVVNMTDEDFLNLPLPEDENLTQFEHDEDSDEHTKERAELKVDEVPAQKDEELDDPDPEEEEEEADDPIDPDNADEEADEPGSDKASTTDDPSDDPDDAESDPVEPDSDDDPEDAKKDAVDDKKDDAPATAQENWDALTAPFRANNSDMQVDNVEDMRRLMSMGANYHKKMVDMKEDRKVIETLRDNDLLTQDKLNLLIDASKGNKDAITKLIKDSGLNPMEVDMEKADDYEATSYQTTDSQLELRDVLSGIRDTATYTQTMDIVSKKWDNSSQEAIMGKPEVLNTINDHVASGVYDIISANVARQRILGRLNDVDDITAYIKVGNELQDAGKFNNAPAEDKAPKAKAVTKAKPKKVVKPADDAKRRQASAPRQAAPAKVDVDLDNLSDEEFAKQFAKLN